jgi:hypothetical protein
MPSALKLPSILTADCSGRFFGQHSAGLETSNAIPGRYFGLFSVMI